MADNQQIIVEHIVNIDTTAENIGSVNAVAGLAVQVSALAGMLPDVAASVQLRAELLAVSRNLGKIGRGSDALPLLETLPPLMDNITAVIGARAEIAAVVEQLHAITSVANGLDTILQAPEYAETARQAAESATSAIAETATNANNARTAQLNAEMAEASAKASAAGIEVSAEAAAKSAADAKQAADAASTVSGLPDASAALPGDPLIWTGTKFGMGGLDESLTSISGVMGISDATLASIAEAKALAEGVDAKATQAAADALEAKTLAEGVDAKATQAATDAAAAKTVAESASSTVGGFATRLEAAETETGRVSVGLGQHTTNGNIHTPLENVVEIITEAVNGAIAQIRDNGTGTLPENVDTLQKLADLLNDVDATLTEFLSGTNPDQRGGMIAAINNAQQGVTTLLANALTRMEVVDNLYSEEVTLPLSAAQGSALRGQVEAVAITADLASKPWIKTVETVPTEWPYGFRSDGLLLVRPTPDGVAGTDVKAPEWYIFDRTKPAKLVLTATQVRMADGTTVQSAVGGAVAASTAAQIAATEAKALAEGVDAKATQALADASEAKTLASGVDGKATQALEKADEALAKTPAIATQTTPGIVKGSDTVEIGEDGSVNVVGGAGALVISSPTITIPPKVAIGFEFDIQLTAGPVLLPGATVANFEMVMDGGAPVTIPAVGGSATVKHTPTGEPETTLTISAVAVDSLGNRSEAVSAEAMKHTAMVNAPAITSPVDGAIVSAVSIPMTGSAFSAVGPTDTQKSRRGRVCATDGTVLFTGPWVTGNVTDITIEPSPSLTSKDIVQLQMQDEGNLLGESSWSLPVPVSVASVVQPSIISPTENTEVAGKDITVVTGDIALTGGINDTFEGADYTIYDISGGVIASANGIVSTSHVFADPDVIVGSYYDIGVVQHSRNHGSSPESAKRRIKITVSRHGEILYDNNGNPAAVITGSYASNGNAPWNIRGKQVWLAVALAAKRGVSISWNTSRGDTNWQDISSIENPTITWKLAVNSGSGDSNGGYVTSQSSEANIDGTLNYSEDIKDSKALTDAIVAHNANYQAAKIARQLVLKDLGAMDLPRIEVLARIYQMCYKIDALDPTASANTAKKLAAWGFGSTDGWSVNSASEITAANVLEMRSNGEIGIHIKMSAVGIIPVLEIPA